MHEHARPSNSLSLEKNLAAYMNEARRFINIEINTCLSKESKILLHPLVKHALLTKGKRLRPIILLLSAQSVGGKPHSVARLAVSFEFLHAATLVHDDIIDQDPLRRGSEALFSKWSIGSATLAGDALISMAAELASTYGDRVTQELSRLGLEMCEGEYLDIRLSLSKSTEQNYLAKIRMKSASLFRGAARCGAIAANADNDDVDALSTYGEAFGMAYQINDDLEDLGNPATSLDLKNGNVTLPLLLLSNHGSAEINDLLGATFGRRFAYDIEAKRINAELQRIHAVEYCRERLRSYVSECKTSLKQISPSVFRDYLIDFTRYFDRRYLRF